MTLHPGISPSTLYFGDCLSIMEQWDAEQVDLIYLDPPFNSNTNYNILFGSGSHGNGKTSQMMAFSDTWSWDGEAAERVQALKAGKERPVRAAMDGLERMLGPSAMLAYVAYMAERLEECRRLLKPSGAIWLHCDPTASHYLKVVMDAIFGGAGYRNEIVWKRKQEKHNLAKRRMGAVHDVIFWYAMPEHRYEPQFAEYDPDYVAQHYRREDRRGKYATFPATNETGGNAPYEFRGMTRAWRFAPETMQRLYDEDRLTQATPTSPFRYKKYLSEAEGVPLDDLWLDIKAVRGGRYPTQKPLRLLERIIRASSHEGDLVLDPFCGCGTTVVAAHGLDRRWAGIDISSFAVEVVARNRLQERGVKVRTEGVPSELASAAASAPSTHSLFGMSDRHPASLPCNSI